LRNSSTRHIAGDSLRDVVECYRSYLGRNRDLANHCIQFLKREKSDPKAAQAEAVVFSWLRAEKLGPRLFEDAGTGGPDFCATPVGTDFFLVETTSLDSEMVAERSGLAAEITGPGGGAFALITEKLKAKAQGKARQLSGHGLPTVLAICSDHAFASILMDKLPAEYMLTSAPQINVPIGGGREYMTTSLKDSVFHRPTGLLDASGAPIIKSSLRSISAILLLAVDHRDLRIVGVLHPDPVKSFNPQFLPTVPFVKFAGGFSHNNITPEWIQADELHQVANFPHRCVR
jgi:hypothetical protein